MLTENQPAILVVDDDEKNLYSLKEILLELDVEVQAVSSGEAALKAIVNQEFFLILMGVCMPGMDGFETVALIRGNENYRNTPVIFVTAQSEKLFLDATYREGVVDIIFKPIVYPYAVICKAKVFLELYLNKKELEQRTFELERKIAIQHKAQQALLVKEQDEWEILNSMVDAVIIMDETGNIMSFNKMAKTLFGYCLNEIIGQNINRLMPESDVGRYDAYLHYYLNTSDARVIGSGLELNGLHKNKQIFPMRLSLAELPANEVGKRLFIGTCQDLTQIKQQQEQLCRAQRMDALGKLTGGIAHDYNNMLGVIIGYSE
ncbi:MAG: response regulator, partial [Methylococcales bacterium]|nr:response regulator [Methylococcales bacterium]